MATERNCPNCGSEDVEPDISETTSFSHGNIQDWICNNCSYRGIMPEGKLDPDTEFEYNNDKEQEVEIQKDLNPKSAITAIILILIIGIPLLLAYILSM